MITKLIKKAKRLVEENKVRPVVIHSNGAMLFEVEGDTKLHEVLIKSDNTIVCDCDYHLTTGRVCSHILAVILFLAKERDHGNKTEQQSE